MTQRKSEKNQMPSTYEQGMTQEERGVVYACFNDGLKVNEIQEIWSGLIARAPISNRQLYLHRERWVGAGRKNKMDDSVNWNQRASFLQWHIEPAKLHILNDLDNWQKDWFRGLLPRPSYRYLYWCSHVLSLAPELTDELDIFMLGTQFYLRDIARFYSQSLADFKDIEGLLSYRPWRCSQRQDRYKAAIIRGDISQSKEIAPVLKSRYVKPPSSRRGVLIGARSTQTTLAEHNVSVPVGRQMLFAGMVQNLCLENVFELPSVKVKSLKAKGINPIETNFSAQFGLTVTIRH